MPNMKRLILPAMAVLWSVLAYLSYQHSGWFIPDVYQLFLLLALLCIVFAFIGWLFA